MLSVVNRRRCLQLVAVAWGLLLLASYLWRPLFPVDETRYVSVAWEMWLNGNYLVPHLNGVFYPDKPPLLFWLINLGWSVFGVSEGWARLVPALFALGSFWLLGRLAERFWPMEARSACLAPLFFLGAIFIALYSTAVMFDMLVVFFALAAVLGLWRAASGRPVSGWLGFGLMVGFGILAKGPVILVYVMPGVLLAPWWAPARPDGGWREWYAGALIGVLLSFAVVAVWLVSASVFASDNYLHAILIDQTADRVSGDIGHGRPVWWYVQWLPLVILPWTLWPPLWRGFTQMRGRDGKRDPGTRLLVLSLAMIFVVLSAVGGKQVHYLLPGIALAALLAAHAVGTRVESVSRRSQWPVAGFFILLGAFFAGLSRGWYPTSWPAWVNTMPAMAGILIMIVGLWLAWLPITRPVRAVAAVTAAGVLVVIAVMYGPIRTMQHSYDLTSISRFLGSQQALGRPLGYVGHYQGQFAFLGRLRKPITVLRPEQARVWVDAHPQGLLIARDQRVFGDANVRPVFVHGYRSGEMEIYDNNALIHSQARFGDGED